VIALHDVVGAPERAFDSCVYPTVDTLTIMSQLPSVRDTGLRLDGARLRRELYIRGCTAATIARLATLSPNTLTRCLAGDAIRQQTLRELVKALATMPVLDVDLVVSPETTKTPSVELDVLNGENGVAATTRRL